MTPELLFDDIYNLIDFVRYFPLMNFDISVVCKYELMQALFFGLLDSDPDIELAEPEKMIMCSSTDYGKEYILTLDKDNVLWLEELHINKPDYTGYLDLDQEEYLLVHIDCARDSVDSAIENSVYPFAIKELDGEANEYSDWSTALDNFSDVQTLVDRDNDGHIIGFTKTWLTVTDGQVDCSSFSFHSNSTERAESILADWEDTFDKIRK